jgi:hypothetical protein
MYLGCKNRRTVNVCMGDHVGGVVTTLEKCEGLWYLVPSVTTTFGGNALWGYVRLPVLLSIASQSLLSCSI